MFQHIDVFRSVFWNTFSLLHFLSNECIHLCTTTKHLHLHLMATSFLVTRIQSNRMVKVARWPVFLLPGWYFTSNLEASEKPEFWKQCLMPVVWKDIIGSNCKWSWRRTSQIIMMLVVNLVRSVPSSLNNTHCLFVFTLPLLSHTYHLPSSQTLSVCAFLLAIYPVTDVGGLLSELLP